MDSQRTKARSIQQWIWPCCSIISASPTKPPLRFQHGHRHIHIARTDCTLELDCWCTDHHLTFFLFFFNPASCCSCTAYLPFSPSSCMTLFKMLCCSASVTPKIPVWYTAWIYMWKYITDVYGIYTCSIHMCALERKIRVYRSTADLSLRDSIRAALFCVWPMNTISKHSCSPCGSHSIATVQETCSLKYRICLITIR